MASRRRSTVLALVGIALALLVALAIGWRLPGTRTSSESASEHLVADDASQSQPPAKRAHVTAGEAAGAPVPSTPDAERIVVRGTVRNDDEDVPMGGALVRVVPVTYGLGAAEPTPVDVTAWGWAPPLGAATGSALTDADGCFTLAHPGDGAFVVVATADGFRTEMEWLLDRTELEFDMLRAETLRVRVLDESGAPISEASVRLHPHETAFPSIQHVRTDVRGVAELQGSLRDALAISAAGFGARAVYDLEQHGDAPVVLRRSQRVAGQVLDSGGDALEGVLVRITNSGLSARTTNADGRFFWEDAPRDGRWHLLVAEHPGFAGFGEWLPDAAPESEVRIDIVLRRAGALVVHVRDAGGELEPTAEVRIPGRWESTVVPRVTAGSHRLGGRQPGTFEVIARVVQAAEDRDRRIVLREARAAATIVEGEETTLELVVRPVEASFLDVRVVRPDGEPVSDVYVEPWNELAGGSDGCPDDDGTFTRALRAPVGTLAGLTLYDTEDDTRPPIDARVRTVANLDGPPEQLTLPERPPEDFVPLVARMTGVSTADAPEWLGFRVDGRDRRTTVDPATGTLSVRVNVVAGAEFEVTAYAAGFGTRTFTGRAPEATTEPIEVELEMEPEARLTGRVVSPAGDPVSGYVFWAETEDKSFIGEDPGPDGRFVLAALPRGQVTLTVISEEFRCRIERTIDMEPGRTHDLVDLVLVSPPQIEGRAVDARGRALGDVDVALADDQTWESTTTKADGWFRFETAVAADGQLRLTRERDGLRCVESVIDALSGARPMFTLLPEATVRFVLPATAARRAYVYVRRVSDGLAVESGDDVTRSVDGTRSMTLAVPAGRHEASVYSATGDGPSVEFEVAPGAQIEITFPGE